MRILFDHGTPAPLARHLRGHDVTFARSMGWERLRNGDLLKAAEQAGFEMLLSVDQGIRYQQNLTARRIAIVVLAGSSKWHRVRLCIEPIGAGIDGATEGSYSEVFVPFAPRPSENRSV